MIYLGKRKGKTVLACAMKGHRGSRGIALLSVNTLRTGDADLRF
jgi:hypothetical protein